MSRHLTTEISSDDGRLRGGIRTRLPSLPPNFTENRARRRDDKRKTKKAGSDEKEKRVRERSGWGGVLTVLGSRDSSLRSTEDVAIFDVGNSADKASDKASND